MPLKLPSWHSLRTFNLCLRSSSNPCNPAFSPIIQIANITKKEAKEKQRLDPYGWAQAQQRKAANQERQKELKEVRDGQHGDPIKGDHVATPFVESFDSAGQSPLSEPELDADGNVIGQQHALPTSTHLLNHYLSLEELASHLTYAKGLTKPIKRPISGDEDKDREEWYVKATGHDALHNRKAAALNRIMSLNLAGGKMKRHANIRRCIEEFGRHNTDNVLRPTPPSIHEPEYRMPGRSGPDTGSSEVQIAILTLKIRKLSTELAKPKGKKDKHNKRNLRLLIHRRQKLLRYMWREEKNSDRWRHMIEKLGLTPACWEGEIVV